MELENPYIEIIILFKNKIEKRRLMNIDLSYDPLLNEAYKKEWIIYSILKNEELDKIDCYYIKQYNIKKCINKMPEWYYYLTV